MMSDEDTSLEIVESYNGKCPPFNFKGVVATLYGYVPKIFRSELGFVRLEDGVGLSRKQRRETTRSRGKKYIISECSGVYCQRTNESPASIVLYVNNIIENVPLWVLKVPFIRDMLIADVFYHEFGHHIHRVHFPEHNNPEDVAENWNNRLRNRFVYRHYWYLLPILLPIAFVIKICKKLGRNK